MRTALITGITGQDGFYLAELLLEKSYKVFGLRRRSSSFENTWRIDKLLARYGDQIELVYGDLTDSLSIVNAVKNTQPDEIYNLAAQSHVGVSFTQPEFTAQVDGLGTLRVLEAVKILDMVDTTKIYQASTSELFGKVLEIPQSEVTPFYPRSPYAVAKIYGYWIVVNYREAYNMFACNGILFNHESPVRGENFVTRKITIGLSKVYHGLNNTLYLGNLNAKRDWGHARDYVEMQHLMLQQEKPRDFVIATGNQCTVRNFVHKAANKIGLELEFVGDGVDEKAIIVNAPSDAKVDVGQIAVQVSRKYFRPTEVDTLLGDPSKASRELGWKPKVTLDDLVGEMMENDFDKFKGWDK